MEVNRGAYEKSLIIVVPAQAPGRKIRGAPGRKIRRDLTGWMLQWYHPHVVKLKQSYPLSPERRVRRLVVAYSQDFYLCDL